MIKRKKVDEDVVEIEDDSEELDEDAEEAEGVEVDDEAGIFDEDLVGEVDDLVEDLVLGEEKEEEDSSFFIGDTSLASGNVEVGWSKEDLEEVVRNERIEKDWGDSDEFVGSDFYEAAVNFYGVDKGMGASYEDKLRGEDLYKNETGGDGLYNTGEAGVYAGKTDAEGVYDVATRGGMKSYDEVADNRRKGRSVLEMVGFEDKEKQEDRDTHKLNADYTVRKAA